MRIDSAAWLTFIRHYNLECTYMKIRDIFDTHANASSLNQLSFTFTSVPPVTANKAHLTLIHHLCSGAQHTTHCNHQSRTPVPWLTPHQARFWPPPGVPVHRWGGWGAPRTRGRRAGEGRWAAVQRGLSGRCHPPRHRRSWQPPQSPPLRQIWNRQRASCQSV